METVVLRIARPPDHVDARGGPVGGSQLRPFSALDSYVAIQMHLRAFAGFFGTSPGAISRRSRINGSHSGLCSGRDHAFLDVGLTPDL